MAVPRDIRRLSLQALYQLDARGQHDADSVRAGIVENAGEQTAQALSADQRAEAFDLALEAYRRRAEADAMVRDLAPEWPTSRQPAVDRAILRLALHEMASGVTPPKVAINEAVELAKTFSTERSPAFLNGVLDKAYKRLRAESVPITEAGSASAGAGHTITD